MGGSTSRTRGRSAQVPQCALLAEIDSLQSAIERAGDDERRRLEAALDVLASYELALDACADAGVSTHRMTELVHQARRHSAHAYASTAQAQRKATPATKA